MDASEADPGSACEFYGGLFGWTFQNVMADGSDGEYFLARHEAASTSIFDLSGAMFSASRFISKM